MQKKNKIKKVYVVIIILLIIVGIGGIVYNMKLLTEREKQIAFLRNHEIEMTKYIKSQNSKIKTVEYDWGSVKVGNIGNGTPQGGGDILVIEGYGVDKNEKHSFRLVIQVNMKKLNSINNMYISSDSFDMFDEEDSK